MRPQPQARGMDRLISATSLDDGNRHVFEGGARADNDRLFQAALRHSRRVRIMRHAIPIGIVLALLSVAGAAYFNPFRGLTKLPLDSGKLVVSGTKITMEAPTLAGFTRDNRPYEFTAKAAAQDITNPGVLELREINAKIRMKDTVTLEMQAVTGVYDTKSDLMHLQENIVITSSSGYKGRLQVAEVDVKKGTVTSDKPVVVEMLNGTLNANNLNVGESGDVVLFGGGVVMDMMMQPVATQGDQSKPEQKAQAQ